MSNTIIQIKRSTTTANPANLQPGELAYTSNGEILFIGSASGSNTANVIAIAGQRFPGVLTANQALIANTSSWIDNIQTAKLIIGTPGVTINVASINATSNSTQLGSNSNTELATTWAIQNYVDTAVTTELDQLADVTITTPSNNQILVYDNDAQQWENHSIQGTANEVEVTFSGQDITVGLPNDVDITTSLDVGANVNLTTSGINVGNSTVNTSITATAIDTDGTLAVLGAATFSNTLTTYGLANLASANVVGNLDVGGTINAGNTTVDGDLTVQGNLNVIGTLTTIDAVNIQIEDSFIRLARNQANTGTFTDAVDIGFYGVYGNTTNVLYTGLARESGTDNYILFANNSTTPDNDGVEAGDSLATLFAHLNSVGLISNGTNVAITANSTVSVNIVANTISLATAITVPNGGTGQTSFTNNGVLFGNSAGALSVTAAGANGNVLQVINNVPTFGMLDGGTF